MKEILAFIRPDKMRITIDSLADAGFPGLTCRTCMGRGKQMFPSHIDGVPSEVFSAPADEILLQHSRLIAKRCLSLVVNDSDLQKAVSVIMEKNRTGKPGDGKIFVLPVVESYRVRTGESLSGE
ncbi:MAG: P-II family nitrogen regulator [Candidatus Methanogranum gryphiswaldense]|nr:MAG: P-II family nitrogen regulator [Candidatus Methanogranum sp. U3.2.1]